MADEGTPVRIVALNGGKGLALRLTELGLNVGTEIRVVQRQGGGLLVARGESRIALGGGMAAKVLVAATA
jgi:ferrous iron transport protein A